MCERRTGSLSTRPTRNALLAVALLIVQRLLSPTVALAASKPSPGKPDLHKAAVAGRYGLLIAAGTLIVPTVAAYLISRSGAEKDHEGPLGNGFRRLIVGEDQRVSTSKTAAVIWTYLLAIALLSIIIAKWLGHGEAFGAIQHSGLAGQYAVLIGGPLGAAILAKSIVVSQDAGNPTARAPADDGPSAKDLIANDDGNTDLGDLQYLLFSAVAMVFFLGSLIQSPYDGLPHLPDVLLGLTSVSATGYVGKKLVPWVKDGSPVV